MGKRLWKVFEGTPNGVKADNGLRVTLGYGRTIYLNMAAFDALDRPQAVELMFDDLRNIIGIRQVDPARKNAFPVKRHTTGRHMKISAAPLCAQYRISPEGTVLFQRAAINEEGILELPLDSLVRVQRGSR